MRIVLIIAVVTNHVLLRITVIWCQILKLKKAGWVNKIFSEGLTEYI